MRASYDAPCNGLTKENLDIDEELIFVLSSHTRMRILRSLERGQMTLTDLSRILDFCKSTIHEHLRRLLDAGLVYRIPGRKWIYYRLSKKGNTLMGFVG